MKRVIVFLLILLLNQFYIYSQTCCSGGVPLSNNLGLPNLGKGTFQVALNYDYNNLNTLKAGNKVLDDSSRLRITHSILTNLNYSITDKFSLETQISWVNQRRKISQFNKVDLEETSGIGDAVILAKYAFSNLIGDNSVLNTGLGVKVPIGSTNNKSKIGILLNADLQPGSGAWDYIFWSSFAKNFNFRPSATFLVKLSYRLPGKNNSYLIDSSYQFGEEFQYYMGVSDVFYMLNTLINPSLLVKYRSANKDKINDFDLGNTGGKWLIIIPNISIKISQSLNFISSLELPIISNVTGTQLTPTYRITTGLLFIISHKKKLIKI